MALSLQALGSRRRTRVAWTVLALLALAALAAGASWWRKARDNGMIVAGAPLPPAAAAAASAPAAATATAAAIAGLAPERVFAQAHALGQRGEVEPALAHYRTLYGHPTLGVPARYNSANLLMRQGQALLQGDAATLGQAIALVELAKQGYRDVLRADPAHWDARYNYERAQRLQPDPPDAEPAIGGPRNDAERASTVERGIAPGLP